MTVCVKTGQRQLLLTYTIALPNNYAEVVTRGKKVESLVDDIVTITSKEEWCGLWMIWYVKQESSCAKKPNSILQASLTVALI